MLQYGNFIQQTSIKTSRYSKRIRTIITLKPYNPRKHGGEKD